MNSLKQFMNKITDKGTQGSVDLSSGVFHSPEDTEGQLSAEGFLCPDCMTAFPSPEALADHYSTKHGTGANDAKSSDFDPNSELESALAQEELLQLRFTLEDERKHSAERIEIMNREVMMLRDELESRKNSVGSSKSQEALAENSDSTKQEEQFPQLVEQIKRLTKEVRERTAEADDLKLTVKNLDGLLKIATATKNEKNAELEEHVNDLCSKFRSRIDELELQQSVTQKEYEYFKQVIAANMEKELEQLKVRNGTLESEIQSRLAEVNNLKEKLSISQNSTKVTDSQCKELTQEVQRLRDQHTELLSRIEGDEATQAAIESLNKERDTLKDNLESSQLQNRELTKNLHNIGLELEKSRTENKVSVLQFDEYKKKMEEEVATFTKQLKDKDNKIQEQEKTCNEVTLLRNALRAQLSEETAELRRVEALVKDKDERLESMEKSSTHNLEHIAALRKDLELSTSELKSCKTRCLEAESEIVKLKEGLEKKSNEVTKLNGTVVEIQAANTGLQTMLEEQKNQSELQLEQSKSEVDSLKEDYQRFRKESGLTEVTLSEQIVKLKSHVSAEEKSHKDTKEELCSELMKVRNELDEATKKLERLTDDLKCQKDSAAEDQVKLKKELEDNRTQFEEKLRLAKDFEKEVAQLKEEMAGLREGATRFQEERDTFQAEKLELDKKYKSSEEARALLLDRCIVGETETEKYQETIQGLQRKLADSLAALQELGRENQSLQVESAKLQGRKWADDSLVTNCYTCTKEFSITIRKHHCRVCGNIFCHECSSRTASIPSSKKPVRVCDPCCEELLTK